MTREISNEDKVIDSRDVIKRIEDLETDEQDLQNDIDEAQEALDEAKTDEEKEEAKADLNKAEEALTEWQESDEGRELKALKALADEASGSGDWKYGETLIRDSYFTDYCEEMVKDIGDMPEEIPHYIVIDWEATAENIKQDYTSVDYDGVTYWIRS